MMTNYFSVAILVVLAWLPASALGQIAQAPQSSGSLVGQVTDPSGAIVAKVKLELVNESGSTIATTLSDSSGSYGFRSVPFGKYTLRVTSPGFKVLVKQLEIGAGQSLRTNVVLAVGSVSQTVEVSAGGGGNYYPPPPPPPPVYNAVFSPTAQNETLHLLNGRRTSLHFYIGPHNKKSALKVPLWTVNPKILKSKNNLPLTITMTCLFCSEDSVQSQVITFAANKRRSSETAFVFTPNYSLAQQGTGASDLLVDVFSQGVQYDHLAIAVYVDNQNTESTTAGEKRVEVEGTMPAAGENVTRGADLIITLQPQINGAISLQLEPIDGDLAGRFADLHLDHGQPRWFQAGDLTTDEINAIAGKAALTLRGIADQSDDALQRALAQSPNGAVNIESSDYVTLSDHDRDSVLSSFLSIGTYLYSRLFQESDPDLKELLKRLESFPLPPGRHLRILIRTNGISLPWQLLHDPSNSNAVGFWGFRYEMTIDSLQRKYPGTVPGTLTTGADRLSVFGVYKAGEGESPAVEVLAHQQADYFTSKMQVQQSSTVDSSLSFLQNLKQHNDNLDFIMVYSHGSSGIIVTQTGDGHLVVQREAQGPRLIFSQTEYIGPIDIMQVAVGTDTTTRPFLQKYPIVMLNACETGTTAISTGFGLTLPFAWLHLGARGVIATESPVSDVFALRFGNDLIDEIANGKDMSQALLDVRLKYLGMGNPFGLLYSFYGGLGINVSHN
jgi:hypothetical protein